MQMPEKATHLVTATASLGGSGTAMYFGLTPGEWQVIGVIGGLAVALVGAFANVIVNVYFKQKHLELAELGMKAGLTD
jgi:hypothetical protein